MATVSCPSCGLGVAVDAKRCPKCGGTMSLARLLWARDQKLTVGIVIACLAFLGLCYWSYRLP